MCEADEGAASGKVLADLSGGGGGNFREGGGGGGRTRLGASVARMEPPPPAPLPGGTRGGSVMRTVSFFGPFKSLMCNKSPRAG